MDNALRGLGFATPMGAFGGAQVTGFDELGRPVYRDATGASYAVGADPQPSQELVRLLGLPDDPQTPSFNVLSFLTSGFTAPGNALRGETVTLGDVWDTAGTAALGAQAMPAPRNSLRMGGLRSVDDVDARGAQIMDMLRSGRAPEITDDMLDMGDPVLNARLNEWLFNNYDLPMDAASRAARAGEMGFDDNLYHGTGADFPAFYDARRGNFFTDKPEIADIYATGSTGGSASVRGQAANAGANYIPVKLRGPDLIVTDKGPDGSHGWLTDNIAASVPGIEKFPLGTYPRRLNEAARSQGYGAIRINDMLDLGGEQTQWMSIDPSGIRSRFARFDPRLAHLRNLSAGVAGAAVLGTQGEDPQAEAINYLRSIGAM